MRFLLVSCAIGAAGLWAVAWVARHAALKSKPERFDNSIRRRAPIVRAPEGFARDFTRMLLRPSQLALPVWMLLALVLATLGGCAQPKSTLIVTVGGLGFSQMHDLRMAVTRQCPEAKVVSAGMWDAYKADIPAIARAQPWQHIILIGHSLGCGAVNKAADQLPRVDLAVFLDPAWDDFSLSRRIARCLWYRRSGFDLIRQAKINGAPGPQTTSGGHNQIPHSPVLIADVISAIRKVVAGDPPRRALARQ